MPRRGAGAGCGRAQGADRRRLGRQLADGVVGHQHIKADPTANLDTAVATHKAMAHTTASGHCLTVQSMWGPAGLGSTKPAAGLFPDRAVEAKMVPSSPTVTWERSMRTGRVGELPQVVCVPALVPDHMQPQRGCSQRYGLDQGPTRPSVEGQRPRTNQHGPEAAAAEPAGDASAARAIACFAGDCVSWRCRCYRVHTRSRRCWCR